MGRTATREEVLSFLSSNTFTGYQAVPLPCGLQVEGKDKTEIADSLFDFSLEGKTVLDVGTYYGFFPLYACRHGARKAVGLEADLDRFQIAHEIARLHGGSYTILHGLIKDTHFEERFDFVLLLNVLHHLTDPIAAMTKLASLCKDRLIVEFCLPSDDAYIKYTYGTEPEHLPGRINRVRAVIRSWVLRLASHRLPIVAIGNLEYHRTFYFSREAFFNLFVIHLRLFENVIFRPGLTNRNRALAICRVKDRGGTSHPEPDPQRVF